VAISHDGRRGPRRDTAVTPGGSLLSALPAEPSDGPSPRPEQQNDPERPRTSVLIVDDHLAFSGAVGIAIDAHDDLACVGAASSVAEAMDSVRRDPPDVVLMDVHLPDGDGIDATEQVLALSPSTRVLILTGHTDVDVLARAASAGACGFLPKESPIGAVIRAIRAARDGQLLVDGTTLAAILGRVRRPGVAEPPGDAPSLTRRERDVLGLMGQGLDPHAIAKELGISLHTCRGYQKSIMAKLDAHSQLETVVIATRRGLIGRRTA
jgi:DNA-binding NarL/FixJ family response regulator